MRVCLSPPPPNVQSEAGDLARHNWTRANDRTAIVVDLSYVKHCAWDPPRAFYSTARDKESWCRLRTVLLWLVIMGLQKC